MRVLLQRIQGIVEGLAQHNMGQVAKHAKRAGAEMLDDVPISDAIELPVEFAILAIETHDKFDELSRACEEGSSASGASKHLAAILAKCNGCHATYRLAPE